MRTVSSFLLKFFFVVAIVALKPSVAKAYSVLTHQALIDASWDKYILPLLKAKYPGLTDSAYVKLHAFSYGGAVAPDMGYYPFGSVLFTNLIHYVRGGDFIKALLDEAKTSEEYAFALGSLCHYYADNYGHSYGVNLSVPMEYPKLFEKWGGRITYEEDMVAHKRIEFAFDVVQTAKGNFASHTFHDYIGFKVCDSLLDRALYKTYSFRLTDIFKNFPKAVNTFRWAVKNFFPAITRAAWASKKNEIRQRDATITAKRFRYNMNRVNYNKEFGRERDKPGFFSFLLAGVIRVLPKVGPLSALKFKPLSPDGEKVFILSFDTVRHYYATALFKLNSADPELSLPNKDFDTGSLSEICEYGLADDAYEELLLKLQEKNFAAVSTALQKNILQFYGVHEGIPNMHSHDTKKALAVHEALLNLKAMQMVSDID